ncbi:MAG: hypothetical protein LBF27_13460 [Sphingobacterium sp.]|jgi:hypothetical protein|nr:hypothetical protein [Sphingobacterium sp.]
MILIKRLFILLLIFWSQIVLAQEPLTYQQLKTIKATTASIDENLATIYALANTDSIDRQLTFKPEMLHLLTFKLEGAKNEKKHLSDIVDYIKESKKTAQYLQTRHFLILTSVYKDRLIDPGLENDSTFVQGLRAMAQLLHYDLSELRSYLYNEQNQGKTYGQAIYDYSRSQTVLNMGNVEGRNPQNDLEKETAAWLAANKISFDNPQCPEGFEYFQNCPEKHAYRMIKGDTIIIYSSGGGMQYNLRRLKEAFAQKDFNIFEYPIYNQGDGNVYVQFMRKRTFLLRNDSLYLYDDYDKKKEAAIMKYLNSNPREKFSDAEIQTELKKIEAQDYGYTPQFKLIYFKGIFNNGSTYQFSKSQNFREESVSLKSEWTDGHKRYYKINLKTYTAGTFIIADDFSFINTDKCGIS